MQPIITRIADSLNERNEDVHDNISPSSPPGHKFVPLDPSGSESDASPKMNNGNEDQ